VLSAWLCSHAPATLPRRKVRSAGASRSASRTRFITHLLGPMIADSINLDPPQVITIVGLMLFTTALLDLIDAHSTADLALPLRTLEALLLRWPLPTLRPKEASPRLCAQLTPSTCRCGNNSAEVAAGRRATLHPASPSSCALILGNSSGNASGQSATGEGNISLEDSGARCAFAQLLREVLADYNGDFAGKCSMESSLESWSCRQDHRPRCQSETRSRLTSCAQFGT